MKQRQASLFVFLHLPRGQSLSKSTTPFPTRLFTDIQYINYSIYDFLVPVQVLGNQDRSQSESRKIPYIYGNDQETYIIFSMLFLRRIKYIYFFMSSMSDTQEKYLAQFFFQSIIQMESPKCLSDFVETPKTASPLNGGSR
jgi:hypothetical protein